MIPGRFLYCRTCKEAHHITPFDNAPIYYLEGTTLREIAIDDRRQFLDKHDDHGIEKLNSVTEDRFSLGRAMDPMKAGYVEVTNGKDFFILRISRKTIADPVSYRRVSRQMMLGEMTSQAGEDEM
ncbi:MAG TPA: hypothetical protein VIE89_16535 [Candidatus Binatia bacterium]|jgi:hypothetical protein